MVLTFENSRVKNGIHSNLHQILNLSSGIVFDLIGLSGCRRSLVIDGVVSEFQRSCKGFHLSNESDSEEGAKISKLLEMSAEPELLMAEMSPEQLNSFAAYQSKLEVGLRFLLDQLGSSNNCLQYVCLR